MSYLISNIFLNNNVYNIELRNEELKKIFIKNNDANMPYKIGDFVSIKRTNGKFEIEEKIIKPQNFLDYYEKSIFSKEELEVKMKHYYDLISIEEYKIILDETIFNHPDFFLYPAAKTMHHAYISGLAEHTLNILELSDPLIKKYDLNRDLLYTGAMLHDYSKIFELESLGLTYSIEGNLLGHLIMTTDNISKICEKYGIEDSLQIIALKHMILAHHGQLDYGSPKEPMIKEAYILSQLDEIDAKMNILDTNLKNYKDNTISGPILGFDRRRFLKLNMEKK